MFSTVEHVHHHHVVIMYLNTIVYLMSNSKLHHCDTHTLNPHICQYNGLNPSELPSLNVLKFVIKLIMCELTCRSSLI